MFANLSTKELTFITFIFTCIVIIVVVIIFSKKEKFTLVKPQKTPDDYLNSYTSLPPPVITNNTTVVKPDNIPEVVSPYYTGNIEPARNKIYLMSLSDLFNGKAYTNFSNIVKRWPSVSYQKTDKGYINVKTPYPTGREQIIPFQNNRIIVMDTDTTDADSYTFECLNKAQCAFVRNLLLEDGAMSNTEAAQQNALLETRKEKAFALEELANYNHGYNTGYSLGLANACMNDPSASNSSSSDIASSVFGYSGDGVSFVGFAKSVLEL
jgi:hypothetical protein